MLEVIVCEVTHVYSGKVRDRCMRCKKAVFYPQPKRKAIILCSQCNAVEHTLFRQYEGNTNASEQEST